ncbi:MAG: class I SAM-dependent methyltransferase [Luteimonas sp.]
MSATQPLDRVTALRIARAFLPARWYGNRWHYHYSRIKLGSDPLYPGVVDALRGSVAALLDLGCGPGLLAHALRAGGLTLPYRGVDNDAGKIAVARQAAERAGLRDVCFEEVDLAAELPTHRGSVAILDVLQYLSDQDQQRTLDAAIAMLAPGARLVIRTGLDDGSRRARLAHAFDQMAHRLGWMNTGPKHYPDAARLRELFAAAGLPAQFAPLSGNTPFNNWLVVATMPAGRNL